MVSSTIPNNLSLLPPGIALSNTSTTLQHHHHLPQAPASQILRCEHDQLLNLVAGAMAGAVSRTATAPLDRLKVMLAVQTQATTSTGIVNGLKHIYKKNGVPGFFRGNGLNVLKISPESAIKFYAYEIMKDIMVGNGEKDEIETSGRLIAGGAAGGIAQALVYPIDLVKTRLQCHSKPGQAPPLAKFTHKIVAQEGSRALFRGLLPSMIGIIPYVGIDLATYETLKIKSRQFVPPDTEPGPFLHLCCGMFSGAFGATCVYPLQLIRTRLQSQSLNLPNGYTGMADVFQRTFAHESMRGFYKGWLPSMLKVAPSTSIMYLAYEYTKSHLSLK